MVAAVGVECGVLGLHDIYFATAWWAICPVSAHLSDSNFEDQGPSVRRPDHAASRGGRVADREGDIPAVQHVVSTGKSRAPPNPERRRSSAAYSVMVVIAGQEHYHQVLG